MDAASKTGDKCFYDYVFSPDPENVYAVEMLDSWKKYYTTDRQFLKDTQQIIDALPVEPQKQTILADATIRSIWQETNAADFVGKYHYIEWERFKYLNKNQVFLQLMSIYNVLSPLLALCIPFIVVLIPFLILKLKGISIDFAKYTSILADILRQNMFGKAFVQIANLEWENMVWAVFTVGLYFFQMYMNATSCLRFVKNTDYICSSIDFYANYIDSTVKRMREWISLCRDYSTYDTFRGELEKNADFLESYCRRNLRIDNTSLLSKTKNIGKIMCSFYGMNADEDFGDALMYSFGFNGFYDNMCVLRRGIHNMGRASFKEEGTEGTEGKESVKCEGAYYVACVADVPIKNDFTVEKDGMMITGPNASGKTTFIKSALTNVLLSQQIGFGFYDNYVGPLYDGIHSYLNIPDTSGRDSLFQAEARRCKEILDIVKSGGKHFCIFDELFSGTNPVEAVESGEMFINKIIGCGNTHFVLTTHFVDLCKKVEDNEGIQNMKMGFDCGKYTYQIEEGISEIKGGAKVINEIFGEDLVQQHVSDGDEQNNDLP